ncbi:MAG: histidine kinase, partial [Bacteroidetes bacterium]|nr:histidine kinase [Bacteroidota bacterium]
HYHKLTELFTNLQSEKLHSQFEALKSQVNPHFLFNSLNVLSSLVHIDSDLSEKFIDKLAKSYRYVLEQKDNELVLLKTEIEFLHSFAFLMKIRFEDKILWKINVDETKQQFFIPPLTLQILVENAIKHNIISKDSPLIIEIFNDEEDNLFIRNNYQPHENGTNSTGIGFKNIMNRYIFFTKKPVEYGVKNEYFVVKIPLINLISKNLTL